MKNLYIANQSLSIKVKMKALGYVVVEQKIEKKHCSVKTAENEEY